MAIDINLKGESNDFLIAAPTDLGGESEFAKVESQPKQQYLKVVAVGSDVDRCEVGDSILAHGSEFQAFKAEDGVQYIVLSNDQVVGVFNV